jgi:hypothetical protein
MSSCIYPSCVAVFTGVQLHRIALPEHVAIDLLRRGCAALIQPKPQHQPLASASTRARSTSTCSSSGSTPATPGVIADGLAERVQLGLGGVEQLTDFWLEQVPGVEFRSDLVCS